MGDGTGSNNMTNVVCLNSFLPDKATSNAQKRPLPLEDLTKESPQGSYYFGKLKKKVLLK